MSDIAVEIDCVSGAVSIRPLSEEEVSERAAGREAEADAQKARTEKIATAQKLLAANPDLAAILEALGFSLPDSP